MKLLVVVPAFNEEKTIRSVLKDLKNNLKNLQHEIIVVNDGSTDRTKMFANSYGVTIASHELNRGLGGAISTGFLYANLKGHDILITFDSDGQHKAKDIKKLIEPLLSGRADVTIGSRMIKTKGMPIDRRVINSLANGITFILYGQRVTDSQSGLRAFSKKAIRQIKIQTNRMEVSSEILHKVKKYKLKLLEVPINPIYTPYSMSKGQKNANAINVLVKLLIYRFQN